MGTLAGILATLAVSHLGGTAAGSFLARLGLLGFGRQLSIASHVLKVGKALRAAYLKDPNQTARADLKSWLDQHDPKGETDLGDGVT